MTWIRFGRNEPPAPVGPLLDRDGNPFDLRRYADGGALLLAFAPPAGVGECAALLDAVAAVADAEPEAEFLAVTPVAADLARAATWPLVYDAGEQLAAKYRGLMEVESAGRPMLFALDRDGAPACAWVGGCDATAGVPADLARRLQSAAFLCPECSVPDTGASALWEAVY